MPGALLVRHRQTSAVFDLRFALGCSNDRLALQADVSHLFGLAHSNSVLECDFAANLAPCCIALTHHCPASLQRFANRPEVRDGDVARYFLRELLQAIECVHRANVAHRDLCADNVLLDAACRVKLANFERAAYWGDLARQELALGPRACADPRRFAPSQRNPLAQYWQDDLYAIGARFLQILGGLLDGLPADVASVMGQLLDVSPARAIRAAALVGMLRPAGTPVALGVFRAELEAHLAEDLKATGASWPGGIAAVMKWKIPREFVRFGTRPLAGSLRDRVVKGRVESKADQPVEPYTSGAT
jgi:hypothetical protein